jgi:diamine N-acetyltransferase
MIGYGYGVAFDTLDKAAQARLWRNEKEIYDNCRQVGLLSEKDQEGWMATGDTKHMFTVMKVLGNRNDGLGNEYIEDVAIGVAGLTGVHSTHRAAEISLYIAKEFQSQVPPGVAKAIIKTLAAYAFEMLNLNRIFGETFATNTIELLNLQELGFVTEGALRQTYYKNGKYIDSVIQSMLRSDYEKLKENWK